MAIEIHPFFHDDTNTFTYVVVDPSTQKCAIIDSVLDYDPASGAIGHDSADKVIAFVQSHNWVVEWILDTHIHADHLTASSYMKEKFGVSVGIGSRIKDVLSFWVPFFNAHKDTSMEAEQFDVLFEDGETFKLGNVDISVIHTPGHTPACLSYKIEDALFVGDLIFMPYVGTGRADFPGGDAGAQYQSIQRLYKFPDATRIFVGHDYPPKGQEPKCMTTIAEEKAYNALYRPEMTKEQYVKERNDRDVGKAVPRLLYPSIQFNMRAGHMGEAETNGKTYMKIPVQSL